jgi:uridine phosphorylase
VPLWATRTSRTSTATRRSPDPSAFVRYWVDQGLLPDDVRAPAGVVVLYQPRRVEAIVSSPDVVPFAAGRQGDTAFLELHTFSDTDHEVGVIGGFGIGAPAATSACESLAAIGVRRFVTIGTAGALRADLQAGAVVVCDRAVRDDGVSHHYLPSATWAEPTEALTGSLHRHLADAGLEPTTGAAWTIDAPFRETVAEARHYADEGVAVVEMEAAALFTVARVREVEVAAAFTVSDSLADGEWVPQFGDPRVATSLLSMVPAATAALHAGT